MDYVSKKNQYWAAEEITTLKQGVIAGYSYEEIGVLLNGTRSANAIKAEHSRIKIREAGETTSRHFDRLSTKNPDAVEAIRATGKFAEHYRIMWNGFTLNRDNVEWSSATRTAYNRFFTNTILPLVSHIAPEDFKAKQHQMFIKDVYKTRGPVASIPQYLSPFIKAINGLHKRNLNATVKYYRTHARSTLQQQVSKPEPKILPKAEPWEETAPTKAEPRKETAPKFPQRFDDYSHIIAVAGGVVLGAGIVIATRLLL